MTNLFSNVNILRFQLTDLQSHTLWQNFSSVSTLWGFGCLICKVTPYVYTFLQMQWHTNVTSCHWQPEWGLLCNTDGKISSIWIIIHLASWNLYQPWLGVSFSGWLKKPQMCSGRNLCSFDMTSAGRRIILIALPHKLLGLGGAYNWRITSE